MYLLRLLPLLWSIYYTDSRPPSSWDWFDLPDHDQAADTLGKSDYYNTFHQMRDQVEFYAPAQHVGKIYRGHYQNPQYLQPRHRAMGWDSDFHHGDKDAFRNVPKFPKPQCKEVLQSSGGFDCICGVPRRKERDPHAASLGTIATDGTGAAMPAMEAIVGGVATERHEYPWQVGVYLASVADRIFCGGSILSSMTILTAAHCTVPFIDSPQDRNNLKVMIAQTRGQVSNLDQHIKVCYINEAPYNSETKDNDFSILTLCTPIKFHPSAQPICLPSLSGKEYEGVQATTTGWGDTSADQSEVWAEELMEANVTTIPNSVCREYYNQGSPRPTTATNVITDNNICAMMEGKDSCQADSGGPLVVQEPCGHFAVVGVVSWGEGCANPMFPGVYARVTQKLDWIESLMQGKTCPPPSLLSVD